MDTHFNKLLIHIIYYMHWSFEIISKNDKFYNGFYDTYNISKSLKT